ncbi:MAG: Hsp20/alpha crystallin family protein [Chloroflexota bacterium]|nr:Hsp20/alpha crystallin family protein [Chloroflexota bacterium]
MTDATAIPINLFENDRELMLVAPMPGVAPEDISVDVHDDGRLTLRALQHGPGQERIDYLLREWSYGPFERTIELPRPVDASRANLSFGNGVLTITFPKTAATAPGTLALSSTGHARGMTAGHPGERGGVA